jgi:hypothetical protein
MAAVLTETSRPEDARRVSADPWPLSLRQRLRMALFNLTCRVALARFEHRTRHAAATNRRTLRHVLRRNRNTEFGCAHGFADLLRPASETTTAFRRSVPLTTYGDYERHVARIARGEKNILSAEPVLMLAGSGGTTDRPKRIPRTRDTQHHHTMLVVRAAQAVVDRGIPGAGGAQRGINLMSLYAPPKPSGSAVPQLSGPNAGIRRVRRQIPHFWSSPAAVFAVAHQPTALYLHALFGLLNAQALYIETPFAPQVVGWLALIERHSAQLVDDLRHGTLSSHLQLPASERDRLTRGLLPSPERAVAVETEFSRGFQGIIGRLWPHMKYIRTVTSGSFALSVPRLRWLAGPDMPLHSGCHASTEGVIGINLKTDGSNDYVLALGSGYFEFIPIAHLDESQPETVTVEDLQAGEEYEVVLTNSAGLCRYRLGDVIRVTGRHRSAPTFKFLYRRDMLLNLVGEKTTEFHTADALTQATRAWLGVDGAVRDYAVCGTLDAGIGRYTFYVELHGDAAAPAQDPNSASRLLDDALCQSNPYYLSNGRAPERLAPAQLKLVAPGTFEALLQEHTPRGSGVRGQSKVPRVVTDPAHLRLLASNVLPS